MRTRKIDIEILIAVSSAVAGVLAGPLFERIISPLFDTSTRALLTGFVFLSLLSIVSVVVMGVFARRQERFINKINIELNDINRRLGLTVSFAHSPPKQSKGEIYRMATEFIEKAESEILILYYSRPQSKPPEEFKHPLETEEYRTERDKYIATLIEKIKQNKNKRLFYRRIIQMPEGRDAKLTKERLSPYWIKHVQEVLEIIEEFPDVGYIKKAPAFLEQSFIIIDQRYVIWGIDSIEPQHGVRYMEGALFFDDPHRELVQYLLGFFERIDAHAIIIKHIPE